MVLRKHAAILAVFSSVAFCLCLSKPAGAQGTYQWALTAQASPDECFEGDVNASGGVTQAQSNANNASFATTYATANGYLTSTQLASCISNGYLPKVNQSYVWGMTMDSNGNIWFGTAANVLCLVLDNYYGTATPPPIEDGDFVCDAGANPDGHSNPEEDYKPPRMYTYNPGTNVLTDLTTRIELAGTPTSQGGLGTDLGVLSVLEYTFGIRSAGNANGVVFFGGLYTNTTVSPAETDVVMYAFNASTMQYLGHHVFSKASGAWYNDMRQWHVIDGNLFTGVGINQSGQNNGALLRWTGSLSTWVSPTNAGNLFSFVDVGDTIGQIAYFTAHTDGHIYATTWGSGGNAWGMNLYMSPVLHGTTGLDTSDASNWTAVWNLYADQSVGPIPGYEVEPTVQEVGGAIASFGGYLYFGTMQVPLTSAVYFFNQYPSSTVSEETVMLDTLRPIEIFSTQGFDPTLQPTPSINILYGATDLEQYNPTTDSFSSVPNGMGQTPVYGAAGFGNVFNNYTWSMAVFQNQLYVGTMDWSYLAGTVLAPMLGTSVPAALTSIASDFYGADLWTFPNSSSAATYVSLNGMGNDTSYGIRNMLTDNNDLNLWLGMANSMNLRTNVSDNPGGWKLIDFPSQNGAPIITWYNPAAIVYGTPLTATQLDATATVSGVYTYSPPLGTVLPAGANQVLSLTFAPYNSGDSYGDTVKITVTPEPLTATANSVTMTYGTTPPAFSGTLTGVVNNDGITASYGVTPTPTSSTAVGTYSIVTTLNDPKSKLSNYSTTVTNGTLTINQAGTMSSVSATAPSVLSGNGVTLTAHVASDTTGTPSGQVTFMDGSTALVPAVTLDGSGNAQLPVSTLTVGSHTITAVYPGNVNFLPSTSPAVTVMVQDFQFNVSSGSGNSASVMPGGTATYSFQVAPTYGNFFPNNVTLTLTGLPTGATATINPSTIPAGSGPTTVNITVQTSNTIAQNRSFGSGMTLAVLFLPFAGLLALRRRGRAAGLLAMLVLGLAMMLGTNGCGNNTGLFTQQASSSTLTVTGTCGSLQHTITLTLTVQ